MVGIHKLIIDIFFLSSLARASFVNFCIFLFLPLYSRVFLHLRQGFWSDKIPECNMNIEHWNEKNTRRVKVNQNTEWLSINGKRNAK